MSFTELGNYEIGVSNLPDYPSSEGYTAEQIKKIFDHRSDKEIKCAINGIIDTLTANTGASEIGTVSGSNVQQVLNQIYDELDNKVNVVSGMELSSNDFTDALKQKLEGIEEGAEKNDVFSVNDMTGAIKLYADLIYLTSGNSKTVKAQIDEITSQLGDISAVLDTVIAQQESLIGGEGA